MTGWQTLFYKEVLRFWKVGFQTVAAPVITAILYLTVNLVVDVSYAFLDPRIRLE